MQKTELVSSIDAVIKTPVDVEYTCTSGNRLLDYVLVDRMLASVVKVEPYWSVPWKSHIALEVTICRAPRAHTMRIACIPENLPRVKSVGKDDWDTDWATRQGPLLETQREERQRYSSYLWLHGDQALKQACEELGALYHRWSTAAEECILYSCEPGGKEASRGRGTMLRTKIVPIILRVAKDESHAGAGEGRIWAGLVSKIQSIDKLRRTGIGYEHGQTMIRVLKAVFAPRLQKLASQVESERVQQVKSWIWKAAHVEEWIDRADEVLIEAKVEERIAEQRRKAQTTITYSQWLETALKKRSKTAHRCTTQTTTSAHPHGLQEQHHTTAEHAGTHEGMG